jgi:hypothetical protein
LVNVESGGGSGGSGTQLSPRAKDTAGETARRTMTSKPLFMIGILPSFSISQFHPFQY